MAGSSVTTTAEDASGLLGEPTAPPSITGTPAAEVLRRLDLTITRRLDGMLHGDYRGLVPGHGTELGETHEYQPGDDVRRMDWNVTARMQVPHVRETIADRELETWIVMDASASLDFGTARCEKRDLAVAAVAAIGLLTARTGNRLGAIILEGGRAVTVPPRSGRPNMMALLQRVITSARADHSGGSDLAVGIERARSTMKRRALLVVVSDFLDKGPWHRSMRAMTAHHEVLAIEVVDPRELELPDVGMLELVDPETGARIEIQTAHGPTRERYATAAAAQRADIAGRIRTAGADHLTLRTDRDWLVDMVRFVTLRRERMEAMSRATIAGANR